MAAKNARKYEVRESSRMPTGLYGWRKRLLYTAVILLLCLILVNIGLTIWILVVLRFNVHGVGTLRFSGDGLVVEGPVELLRGLLTNRVASNGTDPLVLTSGSSILLQVANSSVNLSQDSIEVLTEEFKVGEEVSITNDNIVFNSTVDMKRGAVTDTLSVDRIEALRNEDMRINALGSRLSIEGRNVAIKSSIGDVTIEAFDEINFISNGTITLSSESIILSNLQTINASSNPTFVLNQNVMEVCACADSKKVFLRPAHLGNCATSSLCN